MLVATCSGGVIGGHQQVDLASAGHRPNLVVFLCLFLVCPVFVWVVEIILVVDEMARPGCLCFFVCCFFVCLGVDDG